MKYLSSSHIYIDTQWNNNKYNANGLPYYNNTLTKITDDYLEKLVNKINKNLIITKKIQLKNPNSAIHVTFLGDITQKSNSLGYTTEQNNNIILFPNTKNNGDINYLYRGHRRKIVSNSLEIGFFVLYDGWTGNINGCSGKNINNEFELFLDKNDDIIISFNREIFLLLEIDPRICIDKNSSDNVFIKNDLDGMKIKKESTPKIITLLNKIHKTDFMVQLENEEYNIIQYDKQFYDDFMNNIHLLKANNITYLPNGNYEPLFQNGLMLSKDGKYIFPNIEHVFQLLTCNDFIINCELWKHPQNREHVIKKLQNMTYIKYISIIPRNDISNHVIIELSNLNVLKMSKKNIKYTVDKNNIDNIFISEINPTDKKYYNRILFHKLKDNKAQIRFIKINNISFECVIYPNILDEICGVFVDLNEFNLLFKQKVTGCMINKMLLKIVPNLLFV